MLYNRFSALFSLVLISTLFISCSATSGTANKNPEKTTSENVSNQYPSWYNSNRSINSDELNYYGYATALASDSVRSSKKAVSQAKVELKSAVSSRLESIRNDAVVELGGNSGLESPRFIVALRNAEDNIQSVSEIVEEKNREDGEKVFRSFAKVSADKKTLIIELDKAFTSNADSWNALKKTKAFQKF